MNEHANQVTPEKRNKEAEKQSRPRETNRAVLFQSLIVNELDIHISSSNN
jgi:hypothetical protein